QNSPVAQLECKLGVGPTIKHGSDRNEAVPPLLQLPVALRFYVTGCFHMVVGDLCGLHKSTVCRIVVSVQCYWQSEESVHNVESYRGNSSWILQESEIPRCTRGNRQHAFLFPTLVVRTENYSVVVKGYCSINVQAVCDKGQLTNIVARWPGSTHDSRIFDNSHLCAMLERGAYEGHLLGDNGYACRGCLMTPLLNPQTPEERECNTSHILVRILIEKVFGVEKKRFPCLEGLRTKMDTTLTIIITVAVLYNFGKRQGHKLPEEAEEDLPEENEEDGQVQHAANANGNAVRRTLIENHFAA
uniref:DDE Tnp4 domain-containing protein n=1 Tax=Salmo trutta TaxID=8032 RepID=A0A673WVB2_SALTR